MPVSGSDDKGSSGFSQVDFGIAPLSARKNKGSGAQDVLATVDSSQASLLGVDAVAIAGFVAVFGTVFEFGPMQKQKSRFASNRTQDARLVVRVRRLGRSHDHTSCVIVILL